MKVLIIEIKNILNEKTVLLTIVMIIPTSLYSGDISIIMPTILFIGIISGILKDATMKDTLLSTFIAFLIGSILTFILSLITVYYAESPLYAIALIQYSLVYIILFTIIGCIGGALGHHIIKEIKNIGEN